MFTPSRMRRLWQPGARWRACLLSAALLIGCCILLSFGHKLAVLASRSEGEAGPAALAGVALRDQRGEPLRSRALTGKTLVLSFMFTRCASICPLQTRELARVQQAIPQSLKSEVLFLSVSVDPEHDTPETLQRFAVVNGVDLGNWSLATASVEATQALTRRLQAIDARQGSALPSAHGTSVYVFDRHGRLMQRYAGAPLDRQRLAREIEQLTRMDSGDRRTAAL